MKKQAWGLAAVLMAGLGLRIIGISSRGIWYDDAFSIFLAERSFSQIISGTAADTMPPLYYFLLHFWMAAGQNIAWVRFLNVLLSLGAVVGVYALAAELADQKAGLWAALLAAISPLQIYHAQEVRMYSLLALAQLGYAWFFVRLWKERGTGRRVIQLWVGLVACGAAAMYSHNLAIFGLVVPILFLAMRRQWRFLFELLSALAVIAVLALPWLLLVPGQVEKIQRAFWTPLPGLVEIFQAVILFAANLPLPMVWMGLALFLSLAIFVIVLIESRRIPNVSLLLFFVFLPPLLLFVISYFMRPVFVPRGFLVSTLAFYALSGIVIARSMQRGAGYLVIGAFAAAALVTLPYQYRYAEFPRSPHAQAAAYLEGAVRPGDRVIHDNKLSHFPMRFYQPDLAQDFLVDPPASHNDTLAFVTQSAMELYGKPNLAAAVGSAQRIYFVVYSGAIQEYQAGGEADHPHLAWLQQNYNLAGRQVFNDLEIYEFSR